LVEADHGGSQAHLLPAPVAGHAARSICRRRPRSSANVLLGRRSAPGRVAGRYVACFLLTIRLDRVSLVRPRAKALTNQTGSKLGERLRAHERLRGWFGSLRSPLSALDSGGASGTRPMLPPRRPGLTPG